MLEATPLATLVAVVAFHRRLQSSPQFGPSDAEKRIAEHYGYHASSEDNSKASRSD
jgi:hypothetical protein